MDSRRLYQALNLGSPPQFSFNTLSSALSIPKGDVCGRFRKEVLNHRSAPWFPIDMGESLKLLQPLKDVGRAHNCKFL